MSDASNDSLRKAAAKAFTGAFAGLLKLEPEDAPALWIDGRKTSPKLSADPPADADSAATCVWRASQDTLLHVLEGERQLTGAYVSGRLSIAGDMSIMARLHLEQSARG